MKIRFLKDAWSALGAFRKGQSYDVRDKDAVSLITNGLAEEVKAEARPAPAPKAEA